ncbi:MULTISPECIES: DUF3617 domain-containing protein [unclassified Brevundimonas]|uniref:DUF3617 domain-containing protein n=1 Tax=unclassified Brevundimonas TaxID=2622653 RepID=UPI0025BBE603|nr:MULTISPECIES: DUF3617 family protein [unclassified Brevundimonas]
MKKIAMTGLASVMALTFAACSPGSNKAEGDAAAPDAADKNAAAASLEGPKPGLWRVTTAVEGAAAAGAGAIPAQEVCIKESKLEAPATAEQQGAQCTSTPFTRQGDAMVGSAQCTMPGNIKTESTIRVSGDFNSRYTTEVTTKMDPAPMPQMAETKMTMTAERVGDCPAGS